MNINNIQRTNSVNPYRNNQDNISENAKGKKTNQKDELHISSEAKELHGAQNSNAHNQKVQELKDAVSSGTYHVESNKIAEKLWPYFK